MILVIIEVAAVRKRKHVCGSSGLLQAKRPNPRMTCMLLRTSLDQHFSSGSLISLYIYIYIPDLIEVRSTTLSEHLNLLCPTSDLQKGSLHDRSAVAFECFCGCVLNGIDHTL